MVAILVLLGLRAQISLQTKHVGMDVGLKFWGFTAYRTMVFLMALRKR